MRRPAPLRPIATLMLIAVIGCASCATSRSTETVEEFSVTGRVHAGPTCPVEQDPPDPECADRPVPDASIVITRDGGERPVGEVHADTMGRFAVRLPAGTYVFTPQPVEGLMGTAAPQTITVGPSVAGIDFAYDTGIR